MWRFAGFAAGIEKCFADVAFQASIVHLQQETSAIRQDIRETFPLFPSW